MPVRFAGSEYLARLSGWIAMRAAWIASLLILAGTISAQADESNVDCGGCSDSAFTCCCGGFCACDFVPECYPEAFGCALVGGWLDEWPHSHFSRLGTPMIHFFFTEPAGPERDLIVDYVYTKSDDGRENEIVTELEWAFTRRIGVTLEVPGLILNPNGGTQETGIGDFVVSPRILLADYDRFMLSANLAISTPTGEEERGLGAGEVLLAPSFTGWLDLGNWWTAGFQVGNETGLESLDNEIFYNVALVRSFLGRAVCCPRYCRKNGHGEGGGEHEHGEEDEGNHFPPGLTSLILEYTGRSGTWGPTNGRTTGEMLAGVNYTVTEHLQLRGGYRFPLFSPSDIDSGFVVGAIYHF
jgi:hypothetical protein